MWQVLLSFPPSPTHTLNLCLLQLAPWDMDIVKTIQSTSFEPFWTFLGQKLGTKKGPKIFVNSPFYEKWQICKTS